MTSLIDKYIYDVARRLPEKEREDVKRELAGNIYDMLPDNPTEDQVKAVLTDLGSPAILAGKYRQSPQYLISPTYYNEYVRVLKWVVPLLAVIMLIVGMIIGAFETLSDGVLDHVDFFIGIFGKGCALAVAGAFSGLFWVTVGFVIADKAGAEKWVDFGKWTVDDLEDVVVEEKNKIPLSDSIAELIVVSVFSIFFIAWLMGLLSFGFAVIDGSIRIDQLFSDDFIAVAIPVIAVSCIVSVCECVVKIVVRRWTPLVCIAVVASSLIGIGLMLYLFSAPEIFNPEFLTYLQGQDWAQSLKKLWFINGSFERTIIFVIAAIVILVSLAESASAIYKTIKASKHNQKKL